MNYKDLVTMNTVEAAKKCGLSSVTLAKYCKTGCLRAINIGEGEIRPRWSITEIDLKDFMRRYNGRPNRKAEVEMPQEYYEEKELIENNEEEEEPKLGIVEILDTLDEIRNQRDATEAELKRMKERCKRASGIALELAVLLEDISK